MSLHVYVGKSPSCNPDCTVALHMHKCTHIFTENHREGEKKPHILRNPLVDRMDRPRIWLHSVKSKQCESRHSSLTNKPLQAPTGFIVSRSDKYAVMFYLLFQQAFATNLIFTPLWIVDVKNQTPALVVSGGKVHQNKRHRSCICYLSCVTSQPDTSKIEGNIDNILTSRLILPDHVFTAASSCWRED